MKKYLPNKSKDAQGFTIIEVLIVLAIAALILVVVLIAIPQLQRNQRNSARQNDASRVVTSVQNWSANNNGRVFPTGTMPGATEALVAVVNDIGDLNQYDLDADPANSDLIAVAASSDPGVVDDITVIRVVTGAACAETPAGDITTTDVSSRAVAVQYAAETNDGVDSRCISS